jgi:hypothetical protein
MNRVYPYNVALALSFNDPEKNQVYESFVAGALNTEHYWRGWAREVDFVTSPLKPVEIKSSDRVFHHEIRNLEYFISKFSAEEGVVAYSGAAGSFNKGKLIPFAELFAYTS